MIGDAWRLAAELPSVQYFLRQVVDDLAEGRSVVLMLPAAVPEDRVRNLVAEALFRRDLRYGVEDAAALDWADDAARQGPPARDGDYAPDVRLVHGIDVRNVEQVMRTIRLNAQAAHAALDLAGTAVYLLIGYAYELMAVQPTTEVALAQHWWWGFPSEVEVRVLWRMLNLENGPEAAWGECAAAAFGPGDLHLAAMLATAAPDSLEAAVEMLREYADTHVPDGQSNIVVDEGVHDEVIRAPWGSTPPNSLTACWAAGALVCSEEHGVEVHPASLASRNLRRPLQRRLWRGQISAIYPRIDRIRAALSQALTEDVGASWFDILGPPKEDRERCRLTADPTDAELGYLRLIVMEQSRGSPRYGRWADPIEAAWDARNLLAHYQPLDYPRFTSLWRNLPGSW